MTDTKRAQEIYTLLQKHYPRAKMILNYTNNWELLVAVMLSAQCLDVTVNKVTSKLFPKFRSLKLAKEIPNQLRDDKNDSGQARMTPEIQEISNFAQVPITELEQDIRSTGFYHNKAKNVQAAANFILDKHDGKIPKTMAEMLEIPGVARKTANIVLGNAYQIYEGIAVDTHVRKQSLRFGLTTNENTNKIEQDLMKLYPKEQWFPLTYLLIEHGRTVRVKKDTHCDVCKGACSLEALVVKKM